MKLFIVVTLLLISTACAQTQPASAPVVATTKPADAWTPEVIVKDPAGYLNWIEVRTLNAHDTLKGGQVAMAQSVAALQTMEAKSNQMITVGDKALRELVAVYQAAEAANAWPAQWNGRELSRDKLQVQAVILHKQVAMQKTLIAKVQVASARLQAGQMKMKEAEADAMTLLAEIKANREFLKLQAVDEPLRDKLIAFQPRVAAIAATPVEADIVGLDDLAAQAAQSAKDVTFEQILNDYKK